MGNVDACQTVHAECQRIDTCKQYLQCEKRWICKDSDSERNSKRFVRARPNSTMSADAPLALWSGIRGADRASKVVSELGRSQPGINLESIQSRDNQESAGLVPGASAGRMSSSSRLVESAELSSKDPPLMLPIPSKIGACQPNQVGGMAGMTPGARGVKRCLKRKGTRGTPLSRCLGTAGVTPVPRKQDSLTSLDEGRPTDAFTPSDGITRPKVITAFLKKMMQGAQMKAVGPGFSKMNVWAFVDDKLTALTIEKDGHKRCIPFEQIDDISVGQEAEGDMPLTIDDDCVTLFIKDGQAFAFHFDDADERDVFAECLFMVCRM